MMKITLIAALTAISLATAAPALAGGNSNHWNGNGGGWNHHHGGGGWGWGAPFLGALAGAAIIGSTLAAPYYGYGGYGYAPYYAYPTQLVPQPRLCQSPYGGWYQC